MIKNNFCEKLLNLQVDATEKSVVWFPNCNKEPITCETKMCYAFFHCSSFPIQLENPHVIERHQMMVGVVTKAPDGATLNSSYETR